MDHIHTIYDNYVQSPVLKSPTRQKEFKYRGASSLFAIREARRQKVLKGRKVPILNIVYTTAFLQILIVICITTLITLRKDTEAFFLSTTQTFEGIFGLNDDAQTDMLRTGDLINSLQDKFTIYFALKQSYNDRYIYPENILVENTTHTQHHHHNLIPSARLIFEFNHKEPMIYELNPSNFSILASNTSSELIEIITECKSIYSYFEIESYSFINDVRNLWKWKIKYKMGHKPHSKRMVSSLGLNYERVNTNVSWWNKNSYAFMGSVIASFGLCAFSIMALTRFVYKYGFCVLCNLDLLKTIRFRLALPISHIVALLCGLVYLINLSNILDFNDVWQFRLFLAVCVWSSWCGLVFGISAQGTEFGALYKTLKISFWPIARLLVSLFPIMIGFILFGSLMFGDPDGEAMFSHAENTAKTLYAVWLGDNVLATFYYVGVGNIIAEIYMYSWGILFIAIIFNVGLAIVESNFFETIPQLDHSEHNEQNREGSNVDLIKKSMHDLNVKDHEWKLSQTDIFGHSLLSSPSFGRKAMNKQQGKMCLAPIKLTTKKKESVFLYGHIDVDSKFDEDLSPFTTERQTKYIKSYQSHLDAEILPKISRTLTDKYISRLIKRFPLQSQRQSDVLKNEICKHYKDYLTSVRQQMTQFCVS